VQQSISLSAASPSEVSIDINDHFVPVIVLALSQQIAINTKKAVFKE
jgi:hypothetical protein